MRRSAVPLCCFCLLGLAAPAARPQTPASPAPEQLQPVSAELEFLFRYNRDNLLKAADQLPAADYGFRPTPEMRSVAELLGHVADVQYLLCSAARGEANPVATGEKSIEKTRKKKAEVVQALTASFDYCAPAYAGRRDATLGDPAGGQGTVAHALTLNAYHAGQHYGHLTVYLRLKGLVPPSSQER